MDFIVELISGPTPSDNFVGRSELIDQFHDILMEFVRQNPSVRWIHISGASGVGKSSLLREFRMMTELERISTGSIETPISPKQANNYLTDLKQVIDETAPDWRGFFRRYRNSEISKVLSPPESSGKQATDKAIQDIVEQFFVDLDKIDNAMKEDGMQFSLFLDNLERFLAFGYASILQVLPHIGKKLMKEDYSLLFVTCGHRSVNRYLGLKEDVELDYLLHLELDQFDFNEAELMIRRRKNLSKSRRDSVIQASTRYPFDLAVRELVELSDLDPSSLDDEVITKAFGFNSEEENLMRDLSSHENNYFNFEEYSRLYSEDLLKSLANSLLIIISQDGHFVFSSYALWELISHVYKPIDPRTEVKLILDRLKYQAELGQLPSNRDVKILRTHLDNIRDNSLLFELSGQLADAAKAALVGGLVHTAWELLELATVGLSKTEDYEKIADLQENLAKGFARENHNYYAAKSFETAGEYFRKAGIEWRSITNFREAGQKYFREAEDTDPKIYHYAIRSMLKNSFNAYVNADEKDRAEQVLKDAKDILKDYETHIEYFARIELKGE